LTIDLALAVSELNYMAASVFGVDRDALAGLSLDGFLDQDSARALRSALQSLSADDAIEPYGIQLMPRDGARRSLHASLSRDPEGHGFLLAVLPVDPKAHFA
jgi:nitrogen-specific signal transduction histidine kinase